MKLRKGTNTTSVRDDFGLGKIRSWFRVECVLLTDRIGWEWVPDISVHVLY